MTVPPSTSSPPPPPPKYIVLVALNDPITQQPDLSTFKAFLGSCSQGINYHPGTWHHPMIGLSTAIDGGGGGSAVVSTIDFFCCVHECGDQVEHKDDDTEETFYSTPIYIHI